MNQRFRLALLVPVAILAFLASTSGSAIAAPANDNFAGRQAISGPLPLTVAANNIGATSEAGEPMIGSNAPQKTIWFSWTAPNANPVVIDLCAVEFGDVSQPSVGIAVRTGVTLATLVLVTETSSRCALRLTPVTGTTYSFQIDFRNNEGTFNFLLRSLAPPSNDSFAAPVNFGSTLPVNQAGTTIDSGWEPGEPAPLGGPANSRSVWFSWTAPATGRIRVEQCETTYYDGPLNRQVIVYTGATLATLVVISSMTSVDCVQDLPVIAGTTYRIAVSGNISGEFDFVLKLKDAPPPANDNFAAPQVLGPALPILTGGDNDFATEEAGEPNHGGYPNTSRSVWYSWTADQSGPIRVRACAKGLQLFTSVYTGVTLSTLTEVSERFSYGPCSNYFDAVAGTTYRIAVAGGPFDGWHGAFTLGIHRVVIPANDAFDLATNLGSDIAVTTDGTTIDSTTESFEPDHGGGTFGSDGGSVWYRWTAPNDNATIFSACSSGEPNRIAVYADDPEEDETGIRDLLQVDNDDRACRDGLNGGRLAIAPITGTMYYIAVSPVLEDFESTFTLNVRGTAVVTPPVTPPITEPKPAPFNLKKAIAKCKKIKGKSKKAKRKRANCIKKARKKAAIIKCRKIDNKKSRTTCIRKARKRFK